MEIKNVSHEELVGALHEVNLGYEHNVRFYHVKPLNAKYSRWSVRLAVVSSKGLGHKISRGMVPFGGRVRNLSAACWHVHGHFFDKLLDIQPAARIRSGGKKIYREAGEVVGNWQDYNVGSQAYPRAASDSCGCKGL
jgi:hypothetical protein